jgi:hypothetical protein
MKPLPTLAVGEDLVERISTEHGIASGSAHMLCCLRTRSASRR